MNQIELDSAIKDSTFRSKKLKNNIESVLKTSFQFLDGNFAFVQHIIRPYESDYDTEKKMVTTTDSFFLKFTKKRPSVSLERDLSCEFV